VVLAITSATPAARIGEPDEVANVVLMLASDEARFATGTEFILDGGLTCR
jgi:3alpha(or 20beta)-hydroxysteroid dehydrogenase